LSHRYHVLFFVPVFSPRCYIIAKSSTMTAEESKHEIQTVTGELDIDDVAVGSWEERPKSGVVGAYRKLLKKVELEQTPGSYAPGRWSNAGQ